MKQPAHTSEVKTAIEIPIELLTPRTMATETPPVEITPAQLNESSLYDDADIESEDSTLAPSPTSGWLRWGASGVAVLSLVEAGYFLYQQWLQSYWWGGAWSAAIGCLFVGGGAALWREYRVLRRLRGNLQSREQAELLRKEGQHGNAQAFCRQLANELQLQNLPGYQQWLAHIESHHGDSEVLALFSQFVLRPLDDKALQLVLKSSSQTALLVAASPLALADMLFVLWRNLKMLRDIANIYQIPLGYWGQIRLIRQIVRNMVFAGATELVTELGTDWFSAELTSKLSAKLAQGLGSGVLSARLGVNAIQTCRPLLMLPDEKPKLSQIRKALLTRLSSTVGQFFTGKSADDEGQKR
jgi:putative membrane protein